MRIISSLQTQSWDKRESGQKRYTMVVRAEEVLFLDARQEPVEVVESAAEMVEDLSF